MKKTLLSGLLLLVTVHNKGAAPAAAGAVTAAQAASIFSAVAGGVNAALNAATFLNDYEEHLTEIKVASYIEIYQCYYWGSLEYQLRYYWIDPNGESCYLTYRFFRAHIDAEPTIVEHADPFPFIKERRNFECKLSADNYRLNVYSDTAFTIGYTVTRFPTRVSNTGPNPLPVTVVWSGNYLPGDCDYRYSDYFGVQEVSAPRLAIAPPASLPFPHNNLELLDIDILPHN